MTKEELRQHRREIHAMRIEIYQIIEAKMVMESRAMRTTTCITDEPHGGNTIHDSMAELAVRAADKDIEIARLSLIQDDYAQEVEKEIARLDKSIERFVLRAYYIECMTWSQVAKVTNYSEQHLYRIHGEALTKMRVNES